VSSAAAGALLVLAGLGAAIAGPGVAGAVNNDPVGNPTSPAVSYEADCTNTLAGTQVAPFLSELDANTTVDSAAPTGATFGLSGTASSTLSGAFIANLESEGVGTTPLTLSWVDKIGSTDGHATGSYTYSSPVISVANPGGTATKVSWTSGSTTLTGNFSKAAVGDTLASSGAGFPANATITTITGKTSAVISAPTTAAATSVTVGFGSALVYSDPTFSTGDVFTTDGTAGGTAGVGVVSVTKFELGILGGIAFGGSPGDGPSNCLETGYAGYTVGSPAGPAQTGGATPPYATAPALSPGSTTALVSTAPLQFPSAAYVNLLGPPGAPTSVAATAGDSSAGLTWDAPTSDGGSSITGYVITPYIGTTAQTPIDVGDVTSDTVTGLTNGTTYTFTVAATNGSGTGTPSTASNAVTPAALPGAPTNVVASAGNASASVTWDAPASDGGEPITGYTITPYIGSTAQTPVTVGDVTEDEVTGLTNGTAYTFTVTATTAAGSGPASTASNSVTPTNTVVPPGFPTGVEATAGNASATVTWVAPASDGGSPVTGYVITPYIGTTAQTAVDVGNVLTDDVTGLTNGTTYTFTVSATNTAGTGTPSAASGAVTPTTVPGAPTGVEATAGNASATVTWVAPASDGGSPVTGYVITPYIGTTAQTAVHVGDVLTDDVTGLTNGTTYTFTVSATNAAGTGTPSAASSAVTPTTVPGAPTGVSATAGNASATVTWVAPASDGGTPVTGYVITPYVGTTAQTAVDVGNVLSDDVTGLTNGTTYTFTVAATNAAGTGTASAASAAVTPATLPGAPSTVVATAGGAAASLTWVAPASDGGAAVTHYVITPYVGTTAQAPRTTGAVTSFDVTGLTVGTTYTFTVTATNRVGSGPASSPSNPVTPFTAYVPGYWMVSANGSIYAKGSVRSFGAPDALNSPIVGMASATDNLGYWLVAADGGVFNYGTAGFYGSHGDAPLNSPVVGIAPTPDNHGYWLVGADGGVFAYGDAGFYGSHGNAPLNSPVVGIAATGDGHGYWLVAADGGVFNYGDATFDGSHGNAPLNSPVVAVAAGPNGGYNLFAGDGGVFSYGTTNYGSEGGSSLASPIVGAAG